MTILEVRDLVAGYEPGLPIVRGASLRLAAGEILVLLGPNGAGKSTLARAIAGLVTVVAGEMRLSGRPLGSIPAHRRIREGLAFVPQTANIFADLSVDENLAVAATVLPRAQRGERTREMFALFPDLASARRNTAGRLSGGQRQMLAIARALIAAPSVLVLDEPSAGLSPLLVRTVMECLRAIAAGGVGVLLVEQNARAALSIADRAIVLVDGTVAHEGRGNELLDDPKVAAFYLGARLAA